MDMDIIFSMEKSCIIIEGKNFLMESMIYFFLLIGIEF